MVRLSERKGGVLACFVMTLMLFISALGGPVFADESSQPAEESQTESSVTEESGEESSQAGESVVEDVNINTPALEQGDLAFGQVENMYTYTFQIVQKLPGKRIVIGYATDLDGDGVPDEPHIILVSPDKVALEVRNEDAILAGGVLTAKIIRENGKITIEIETASVGNWAVKTQYPVAFTFEDIPKDETSESSSVQDESSSGNGESSGGEQSGGQGEESHERDPEPGSVKGMLLKLFLIMSGLGVGIVLIVALVLLIGKAKKKPKNPEDAQKAFEAAQKKEQMRLQREEKKRADQIEAAEKAAAKKLKQSEEKEKRAAEKARKDAERAAKKEANKQSKPEKPQKSESQDGKDSKPAKKPFTIGLIKPKAPKEPALTEEEIERQRKEQKERELEEQKRIIYEKYLKPDVSQTEKPKEEIRQVPEKKPEKEKPIYITQEDLDNDVTIEEYIVRMDGAVEQVTKQNDTTTKKATFFPTDKTNRFN